MTVWEILSALAIVAFILVALTFGALYIRRQQRLLRSFQTQTSPLTRGQLLDVQMAIGWYASSRFQVSFNQDREYAIEVAQFLASASSRLKYLTTGFDENFEAALTNVACAVEWWLDTLFYLSEGANSPGAFAELQDLFIEVREVDPETVRLFGSPPLVLSPMELFDRLGVIDLKEVTCRYCALRERYVLPVA